MKVLAGGLQRLMTKRFLSSKLSTDKQLKLIFVRRHTKPLLGIITRTEPSPIDSAECGVESNLIN